MVDFNNDSVISKPPKEVVALIIIEKVYNFLEADEYYCKTKLNGAEPGLAISRSRPNTNHVFRIIFIIFLLSLLGSKKPCPGSG